MKKTEPSLQKCAWPLIYFASCFGEVHRPLTPVHGSLVKNSAWVLPLPNVWYMVSSQSLIDLWMCSQLNPFTLVAGDRCLVGRKSQEAVPLLGDAEERVWTLEVTVQTATASLALVPGEPELGCPSLGLVFPQVLALSLVVFLLSAFQRDPSLPWSLLQLFPSQLISPFLEVSLHFSGLKLTVDIFLLSFRYFLSFLLHLGWPCVLQPGF